MKTLTAIVALSFIALSGFAQTCTSCTQTISSANSGALTINSGDVVCITATGTHSGTIYINGGVLCNEGEISGGIFQYGGEFNNHGLYENGNFQMTGGSFYNDGDLDFANFNADGDSVSFINDGWYEGANFTMIASGGNTVPIGENNGAMLIASFLLNGAEFSSTDTMDLTGSMQLINGGSFENSGPMRMNGSWQSTDSYFYTECTVIVDGNWSNFGEVEGPSSGGICGGFEVHGVALNDGDLAIDDSYIDVCEVVGGSVLNTGNAALGANVTECQCTNICMSNFGGGPTALAEHNSEQFLFDVFPNPAHNFITVSASAQSEFIITDMYGRVVEQGNFAQGVSTLDVGRYATGVYFIRLTESSKSVKLIVR